MRPLSLVSVLALGLPPPACPARLRHHKAQFARPELLGIKDRIAGGRRGDPALSGKFKSLGHALRARRPEWRLLRQP